MQFPLAHLLPNLNITDLGYKLYIPDDIKNGSR